MRCAAVVAVAVRAVGPFRFSAGARVECEGRPSCLSLSLRPRHALLVSVFVVMIYIVLESGGGGHLHTAHRTANAHKISIYSIFKRRSIISHQLLAIIELSAGFFTIVKDYK